MQNILIGVKRFFKNKNTVTIIALVVCLGLLYFVYHWRIEKATNPSTVVYAKVVIGPRTYITEDMVSTKKVPGELVKGIYQKSIDVVGKYVKGNAVVPMNGLFYTDYIGDWESVSTSVYSGIEDGDTIFYLPVDKNSTFGNSIFPGNYIDLYFASNQTDNGLTIGKFVESIQVLAVTDSSGRNVFETAGTPGSPKYLIFAVNEELHLLLRKTVYVFGDNSLFPVPRGDQYCKDTRIVNSEIKSLVLDRTFDVPESALDGIGGANNG